MNHGLAESRECTIRKVLAEHNMNLYIARAELLVTVDKDLLELGQFGETRIVSPGGFFHVTCIYGAGG